MRQTADMVKIADCGLRTNFWKNGFSIITNGNAALTKSCSKNVSALFKLVFNFLAFGCSDSE